MLANFYYEPSPVAVVLGAVAALGLVIALGFTKRPAVGCVGSAVGCGIIAFVVWACGQGDVIGLAVLVVAVPLAAILGGLAGRLSAVIVRDRTDRGEPVVSFDGQCGSRGSPRGVRARLRRRRQASSSPVHGQKLTPRSGDLDRPAKRRSALARCCGRSRP